MFIQKNIFKTHTPHMQENQGINLYFQLCYNIRLGPHLNHVREREPITAPEQNLPYTAA